ncbi:Uncharacterised protein [Burkholderia cenocepacia]|nr:Uncharacterised protein [Burkholderia cenocepacia]
MARSHGTHNGQSIRLPSRSGREESHLDEAVRERLRVHSRRRPELGRDHRRRQCADRRHDRDARDGAGPDREDPQRHRQADQARGAVALPRGARARRVRVFRRRRAARDREPRHVRDDRRARRGRHEVGDRALPAPVRRRRDGAGPDLADARVRARDHAVPRQARSEDHARRLGPHEGRHDRLAIAATRSSNSGRPRSRRCARSAPRSSCRAAAPRC